MFQTTSLAGLLTIVPFFMLTLCEKGLVVDA